MKKWYREPQHWERHTIQQAICDDHWQHTRISMKGVPTQEKLEILQFYLEGQQLDDGLYPVMVLVRVDNYINALKRGGQLNMQLEVAK